MWHYIPELFWGFTVDNVSSVCYEGGKLIIYTNNNEQPMQKNVSLSAATLEPVVRAIVETCRKYEDEKKTIYSLKQVNETYKNRIQELEEQIAYMPDGVVYKKAKEHFETLTEKTE
jgi:hypothetical protein